jgi:hypothetical protein
MAKNKSQASKVSHPDQSLMKRTTKPVNILVANEGQHADDEPIYSAKFPFAELIPGWDRPSCPWWAWKKAEGL